MRGRSFRVSVAIVVSTFLLAAPVACNAKQAGTPENTQSPSAALGLTATPGAAATVSKAATSDLLGLAWRDGLDGRADSGATTLTTPGTASPVPSANGISWVAGSSGQAAHLGADDAYIGYLGTRLGAKEGSVTFKYKPIPNLAGAYATNHERWTDYGQYKPPQSGFLLDTAGWGLAPTGALELILDPSATGGLSFGVWDGSKWHYVNWKTPAGWQWDSSRWYEIGVTWGSTGMGVIVDGQLAASIPDVVSVSNTNAWFLGQAPGYAPYGPHSMMGSYDEVRVFGVASPLVAAPSSTPTTSASPDAPLLTTALDPSTADQTVSYQTQVKVTVPGGTLDSKQILTISPALPLPPQTFTGVAELAGFDIAMGDVREFKKGLTIEIAYDPTKLPEDLAPQKALFASFWDPAQKLWVYSPVTVDSQRKVVVIQTDHLTTWKVYYILRGYGVKESDHFLVVYDRQVIPIVSGKQVSAYSFSNDVSGYLEQAYAAYAPATNKPGYRMPGGQTHAFVVPGTEESQRGGLTGNVYFALTQDSAQAFMHEAAHELFHVVQNQYFNVYRMGDRAWWIEATADYAAYQEVWKGKTELSPLNFTYFNKSITTRDGKHEYQTANFVAFLVKSGMSFKEAWDAVAEDGRVNVLRPLEAYVQTKTKASLQNQFRNFVRYALFDPAGPLEKSSKDLLYSGVIDKPDILDADKKETTYTFNLKPDYTAAIWGLRVQAKDDKTERPLHMEITGTPPPSTQVQADVYLLKNDVRPQGGTTARGTLDASNTKFDLRVVKDDVVYIVAVNSSGSNQSLTVKVTEGSTGTWVLMKREVGDFGSSTGSVSGNTATVTFHDFQEEVSSWTCSWPEPPAKLAIGQKWGGAVTVSDFGSKPSENYWARGGVSMVMSGWKPGPEGTIIDAGGRAGASGIVGGTLSPAQPSPTPGFSWIIPENGLHISARCDASTTQPNGKGGGGPVVAGVDYYYELQK